MASIGRKCIAYLLLLSVLFSLTACSKSPAVQAVEQLILQIGEVTKESEDKILAAEEGFALLTPNEQKDVDGTETLKQARQSYNQLFITEVEDAINAIGTVTCDSKELIETAQSAYDGLPSELRNSVNNYTALTTAQDAYQNACAQIAIDKINAIGSVSYRSGDKIAEARAAYDALTDEQKFRVTNYNTLQYAENAYSVDVKAERRRRFNNASGNLETVPDYAQDCTFYLPYSYPDYVNETATSAYIADFDSTINAYLRIQYEGDDWLFMDTFILMSGSSNYTIEVNYYDVERDNQSGRVWEYTNVHCDSKCIEFLEKAVKNGKLTIRMQGKYYYDYAVSKIEIQDIKDILTAYKAYHGDI